MALLIPWRSSPALGGSRARARRAIRPTKPQQDPQRYLESAVVRYSLVRTKEFTVVGADRPPVRFSTIFWLRFDTTGELSALSSSVSMTKRDSPPARRYVIAQAPQPRACGGTRST